MIGESLLKPQNSILRSHHREAIILDIRRKLFIVKKLINVKISTEGRLKIKFTVNKIFCSRLKENITFTVLIFAYPQILHFTRVYISKLTDLKFFGDL